MFPSIMDIMKQAEELAPTIQKVALDFESMNAKLTRIESKLDLLFIELEHATKPEKVIALTHDQERENESERVSG